MRLHHKAKDKEETRQLRQAVQKIIQQNLRIVFCRRQRRKKTTLPSSTENNSTESENGILQNHCIDNIKTISKDNSENALLCSLLRQSTYFFSWLSKQTHSAIKTCNSK